MTSELRLGLVGCGRLAELGYLPALRAARGIRLAAIADPVLSRCRLLAPECARYESAAALVGARGVDVVVLATPAGAHLADAKTGAQAGLPVLVEKPPAPDSAQATALARLEPRPWVGFNRRFDPGLVRLRARVEPNQQFEIDLESHHPGPWRSHLVDDDVLLANGSHLIDLSRWLAGSDVERVRATEVSHDFTCVELGLARGRARISCAWGRPHRERVEIRGSDGSRVGRHVGDSTVRANLWRLARRRTGSGLARLLALELEELVSAVRGGAAPTLATALDGAAVMAAIDAARCSAKSGGGWVDVGAP